MQPSGVAGAVGILCYLRVSDRDGRVIALSWAKYRRWMAGFVGQLESRGDELRSDRWISVSRMLLVFGILSRVSVCPDDLDDWPYS